MKIFGTINPNDYTIENLYTSAELTWGLLSSSNGMAITSSTDLAGAVTIQRATSDALSTDLNTETDKYAYLLHRSVKNLFYDRGFFRTGSSLLTTSPSPLPSNYYVVSVGQNFYGDRVKPGSFVLSTEVQNKSILDDGLGNLFISESSTGSYVGNIFYDNGLAIIKENSGSSVATVSTAGVKLISGSTIYVGYKSDTRYSRHEVHINLDPTDFNFSAFNPSIFSTYETTGSAGMAFNALNIKPSSGSNTWNLSNLMAANVLKPYVTTIGLYNKDYQLVAVAKLNEPIQRTFDTNQIFIVRFDI
jgi:hypothetical protein